MFGIGASVLARLVPPPLVAGVLALAREQDAADAADAAVTAAQGEGSLVADLAVGQAATDAVVHRRVRGTSPLLGVYLVLAGTLFPQMSVSGVFETLTSVMGRKSTGVPSRSALNKRRASLSARVFQLLFARLCGAVDQAAARYRGLLVCAWDGTTVMAPDTPDNREYLGAKSNQTGPGAYPLVRLLVLIACGTRTLIDAAVGPVKTGENPMAERLVGSLHGGMLLLADRLFPGFRLWCQCADTGCRLLWRVSKTISLVGLESLPDGSALGWWNASTTVSAKQRSAQGLPDRVRVRVVTGWITVIDDTGVRRSECYRLITTLLDCQAYPARELLELYARRWQVEIVIKGMKCAQLVPGVPLRSRTSALVMAEVWALLCTHQLLRQIAAGAVADTDTDTDTGTTIAQINFTALVRRFRQTIIRTAGRAGARAGLRRLHEATATDTERIRVETRQYDRVRKRPVSKFAGKKPDHSGGVIVIEYDTEPCIPTSAATTDANLQATTTDRKKIAS